jgi:hypothetical protein
MLNHPDKDDPVTAFALAKESGQYLYYLSARELFDEDFGIRGWFIQHCGAYSVIRGEPPDLESREATINLIAQGRHKLVMFPEGDVTGRHDKILALKEDGIKNIIEAQRRLLSAGEPRPVYLLPTTSYYQVTDDADAPLDETLRKIEAALKLTNVAGTIESRAMAAANRLIENFERDYGIAPDSAASLPERIRQFCKNATIVIAQRKGIIAKSDEPPAVILYSVRGALRKMDANTADLDKFQQLMILSSTLDSLTIGKDVVWRVVDRIEQLQFGKSGRKGKRTVHVDCGDPISLMALGAGKPNELPAPELVEREVRTSMMNVISKLAAALAAWLILNLVSLSQSGYVLAAGNSPRVEAMKEGAQLIDEMLSTAQKWRDYTCVSELDYFKGGQEQKRSCRFFYKDGQVRVEVTGGGYRDGSILVRSKAGAVRGRGGMMMAFITMDLDPDSRMLILPNGVNVTRTDLPDLLTELKRALSEGSTAQLSQGPVNEPGINSKVLVLDILNGSTLTRRLIVDAERRIPIRWDLYRDGERLSSAWFRNLRPNAGLDDKLFHL